MSDTAERVAERLYRAASDAVDRAFEDAPLSLSHPEIDKTGATALLSAGLREAVEELERADKLEDCADSKLPLLAAIRAALSALTGDDDGS